ncbi:MAG TPA: serine hydrolase domain-containing protein [Pirellulales bacterium]|jgi:CubicO group peptidase (beta-lactamase class C family)|nr:serine hydrolase domain-containing protein [Pirellulales bacterium]
MTRHLRFAPFVLFLFVVSVSQAGDSAGMADVLQPYVDRHELAGIVTVVADKDKVLATDAVGYADIAAGQRMTADALFWIASQSKPITGTALMMLVDDGKVNVDDPVEKYLPEFKEVWLSVEKDNDHQLLRRPKHQILVRHVLSHTSGLPFKSALEQPTLDLYPLAARVLSYPMTPLDYEPTQDYKYSNAGINTAGRIVEVASGMPYEKFLDERLFKPLGMNDTTFWPEGERLRRLAKPYKPNAAKDGLEETTIGQLQYPLDDRTRQPMPAGGLFSTAHDMTRYYQMLAGGGAFEGRKYLSPEAVSTMTHKQTGDDVKTPYGFGFATDPAGGFGHGGAYGTHSAYHGDTGLITVYLIQAAGFFGDGKEAQGAFERAAKERYGKH